MASPVCWVLATGNPGKARELEALLAGLPPRIRAQADLGVGAVEETGLTFVENALIKARHAAEETGLPALADDSGIEVDCLDGAPGIRSARYAGPGASDAENLAKLVEAIQPVPTSARTARYRCVVVFLRHPRDAMPIIGQGTWEGRLLVRPRGRNGFGYDPIFYLPGLGATAAELDPATKDRLSHRARALAELRVGLASAFGFR